MAVDAAHGAPVSSEDLRMAGKTATTALQTAIQGGKVSDKAAQSALGHAVERIASLTKRAQHSKEAMLDTGTVVLHTAETQGALFLASLAEGYLGDDKIKVGAVDLRGPVGLLAQGYGLYQTMTGQKGAGAHVLAVGNGLVGSWLASVGRNAGQTLSQKRAPTLPPPMAPPGVPPIVMQGGLLPEPGLSGPMREVLLTPETEGDELGRGGRRRRMRQRMRQRMQRHQQVQDDSAEGLDGLEGEELGRRRGGRRGRFVRADDESQDLD
jgi:hypothetical protein